MKDQFEWQCAQNKSSPHNYKDYAKINKYCVKNKIINVKVF